MELNEAYDATMRVIDEIKKGGINVKLIPSRSRNNPKTVKKYDRPDRIPPEKWYHVSFSPETAEEINIISESAQRLRKLGISFDTGGCPGQRDWEIDWSFQCRGAPDEDSGTGQGIIEDLFPMIGACSI